MVVNPLRSQWYGSLLFVNGASRGGEYWILPLLLSSTLHPGGGGGLVERGAWHGAPGTSVAFQISSQLVRTKAGEPNLLRVTFDQISVII